VLRKAGRPYSRSFALSLIPLSPLLAVLGVVTYFAVRG
jgi:hypothetical protein